LVVPNRRSLATYVLAAEYCKRNLPWSSLPGCIMYDRHCSRKLSYKSTSCLNKNRTKITRESHAASSYSRVALATNALVENARSIGVVRIYDWEFRLLMLVQLKLVLSAYCTRSYFPMSSLLKIFKFSDWEPGTPMTTSIGTPLHGAQILIVGVCYCRHCYYSQRPSSSAVVFVHLLRLYFKFVNLFIGWLPYLLWNTTGGTRRVAR